MSYKHRQILEKMYDVAHEEKGPSPKSEAKKPWRAGAMVLRAWCCYSPGLAVGSATDLHSEGIGF